MMTRSNVILFWGFWFVLTSLWLVLNPDIFSAPNLFALRSQMMQMSGTLAMAAMSVAMILSLRPRWLEDRFNGLDKTYRIHKWLGIGALGLVAIHWLWSEGPKWAVKAGLLARPERGGRPAITDPIEAFLRTFRHTAEEQGEWAIYAIGALLLIALIKFVPYRYFRYTHRVMPALYLVLAFHAVVLFDFDMWATPLGLIMGGLLLAGTYAAVVSLTGRIGSTRKRGGTISGLTFFPGVHSLKTEIDLGNNWPGHKAGQFAFVTTSGIEGAHPYTIASAWNPDDPKVSFIAKELGDHTKGLKDKLYVGQKVKVEGPYGRFTFDDNCPRQIWIGGGIGITPFIARMKELAERSDRPGGQIIDLFHCTREVDEDAMVRLAADAKAAGITLHLFVESRDGLLTGEEIRQRVPEWQQASLWFCGPRNFGKNLRADFAKAGFRTQRRFHQELFEMR